MARRLYDSREQARMERRLACLAPLSLAFALFSLVLSVACAVVTLGGLA